MNCRNIVCPHDPALLGRFRDRAVAVRVDDAAQIRVATADVAASGNRLIAVILESRLPVDSIELSAECGKIPIVLRAPSLGKFRNLVARLGLLRSLNLQVYLPCERENLVGVRLLASVGIRCGVSFGEGEPDFETLADLMTYAILGRAAHAPIEPFAFVANHYVAAAYTDWGAVYFDDPKQFLHLDSEGRVALSGREMMAGEFIAQNIGEEEAVAEFPAIAERVNSWRQLFADTHPCSTCAGWRACLGKFARNGTTPAGCCGFLAEWMEVVDQYQAKRAAPQEPDKCPR